MAQDVIPPFPSDEHNPYAPPKPHIDEELELAAVAPTPFDLGAVLTRAWEIYQERMGFCMLVVDPAGIVNWVLVQSVIRVPMFVIPKPQQAIVVLALAWVASILFVTWINTGMTRVILDVAKGRETSFGGLFNGGRYFFPVLVAYALLWALTAAVLALGALPGAVVWLMLGSRSITGPIIVGLGVAAGLVAAVAVWLRFSQVVFLIIDGKAGITDSFRISSEITRGKALMILVIYLVVFGCNVAGACTCYVGLAFTAPFGVLLPTVAYLALTGQPTADPFRKGPPIVELEPI
jgi:hypothetical protein